MRNPLDKVVVTQPFGARPEYYAQFGLRGHEGVDLQTKGLGLGQGIWADLMGWQVARAVCTGVCRVVYGHPAYGTYVDLTASDGRVWRYAHLKVARPPSSQSVVPGKDLVFNVVEGESVGITGRSGNTSGPHLHLMTRPAKYDAANGYGGWEDPMKVLAASQEPVVFRLLYMSARDDIGPAVQAADAKLRQFSGGRLGLAYSFLKIPIPVAISGQALRQEVAWDVVDRYAKDAGVPFHGIVLGYKGDVQYAWYHTATSRTPNLYSSGQVIWPADVLLFEVKHQLVNFYNRYRGQRPWIELIDNYSGGEHIVQAQVEQLLPYLDVFRDHTRYL